MSYGVERGYSLVSPLHAIDAGETDEDVRGITLCVAWIAA